MVAILSAASVVCAEPILYITKAQFEVSPLLEDPRISGYIEDEGARKDFSFTVERQYESVTEPIEQRWVRLLIHTSFFP